MKAAVLERYGDADGVRVREVAVPVPKADELLVRVHTTTVTMGDTELRTMRLPWLFQLPLRLFLGLFGPRAGTVLGMELAGVVEAVGSDVTGYAIGDAVFGATRTGAGAHAELACLPVGGLVARKPAELAFAEVTALPIGGLEALGYLRKGGLAQGVSVLIRGSSGGIGTFAVQLARHLGAHVTAVCGPEGVEEATRLGADAVIDYTVRDWTDDEKRYDLVLDVIGRMPVRRCLARLTARGTYVRGSVPGVWEVLQALIVKVASRKRFVVGGGGGTAADLSWLAERVQAGELRTVVDRVHPLKEIAEAHRYVGHGHKQGHVLIEVAPMAEDAATAG
jgi:NADPH:quinone reductase-like Zn-dependent oxidoreductase